MSRKSSYQSSFFPSNLFCNMHLLVIRCFSRSNSKFFPQNLSNFALKEFTISHSITSSGSCSSVVRYSFKLKTSIEGLLVRVLVSLWKRAAETLWSYPTEFNLKVSIMSPLIRWWKRVALSRALSLSPLNIFCCSRLNIFNNFNHFSPFSIPQRRCVFEVRYNQASKEISQFVHR